MTRLVIFDLDGTLVDAYEAIVKSLNFTRAALGYAKVDVLHVKKAVGKGDRNFIEGFFKKRDRAAALRIYRAHHKKALVGHARLMPYARQTLLRLKKHGLTLAVASNRPAFYSNILVRHLSLRRYFDVILCAKSTHELKPNPKILRMIVRRCRAKPSEAVYVGDMVIDVETARNAHMRSVAITTGSSSRRALLAAKPSFLISRLNQLPRLV